jgi:hypothetical protein
MALTTIGLSNLTFGTTAESSAVVRSYEETVKCDPVELMAGNGTFQAVAFANPNTSASITIVSGTVSGSIGSAFSQTGNTYPITTADTLYVESCSRTLTNDGFSEVQISAVGYLNLGSAS